MDVPFPGHSKLDRALATTFVAGLVLLMLVGLVFTIAYGSQRITTDATALHSADELLRSATVARAQLALAVNAGVVDSRFGSDSSEAIETSLFEAEGALVDLEDGLEALAAAGVIVEGNLDTAVDDFVATVDQMIALMNEGRSDEAHQLADTDLNTEFKVLVRHVTGVRDKLAASVASSDQLLARVGNVARFLVAFLLPAAVIFVYRGLIRRQARQAELESRLEAERRVAIAREEFIANASHELRTPLTSITGLAHLLAEDPVLAESESAAEFLELIISESGDLARMVEDLLTAARLDVGALAYSFEDVDMEIEITEVADSMKAAGGSVSISCAAAHVRADPIRVRQILRNLISNARKYGGPDVRLVGRVEGHNYVCEVIDNGLGIPDEIANHLFERFVHTGRETSVKGSVGLGLSIVRSLANGMGGNVSYHRSDGESHFVVRLPLGVTSSNRRDNRDEIVDLRPHEPIEDLAEQTGTER